jgi:predicted ester cyclase
MEDLIKLQRKTIDQHVFAENAHDWERVYDTFVQDESVAFYDVIPLHTQFSGLTGVKDFYQAAQQAFPDFRIEVWSESDAPGCSLREVTLSGTHKGDWCGLAGTGRKVKFHLAGVFLFGSGEQAGKIVAERIYFDNETVLQQINGLMDVSAVPSFAPSQRSSGAFG